MFFRLAIFMTAVTFVVALPGSAKADFKNELAKCANEKKPTARLECYDRVAARVASAKHNGKTVRRGRYELTTLPADQKGDKDILLSIKAERFIKTGQGRSVKPTLVMACRNDKTSVGIGFDEDIGKGQAFITYRFDELDPITQEWETAPGNRFAFAPEGYRFAKRMLKFRRLEILYVPLGQPPKIVTYNLTGLIKAVDPLRRACHWVKSKK